MFGKDNTINCYLDVEIGAATIVADWVYVTDFDHRIDDVNVPIKDQGIVKTPVRIGPDCWIGAKVTRPARGSPSAGAACSARTRWSRGDVPEYSIAVGAPARVVRNRQADYEAAAAQRARRWPTSPARPRPPSRPVCSHLNRCDLHQSC